MEIKKLDNMFYIGEDATNRLAEITFIPTKEDVIVIDHTFVGDQLRGQGIARKLVDKVVEYARSENIKIYPMCSYAVKVLNENDEYEDILSSTY